MSHKGVLASDPSVAKMSKAQWLFEYLAIQRKVKEDREFSIKALKNVIVNLFGMNLHLLKYPDADPESFIPYALIGGNPDLLRAHMEKPSADTSSKVEDNSYEMMAQAIEGGMDPIVDDELSNISVQDLLNTKDAELLNIRDEPEDPFADLEADVVVPSPKRPR